MKFVRVLFKGWVHHKAALTLNALNYAHVPDVVARKLVIFFQSVEQKSPALAHDAVLYQPLLQHTDLKAKYGGAFRKFVPQLFFYGTACSVTFAVQFQDTASSPVTCTATFVPDTAKSAVTPPTSL